MIYNTTFHIERAIWDESLAFLRQEYIPKAMADGKLQKPMLSRVMRTDENEGISVALQFHVADEETLSAWFDETGHELHHQLLRRFGNAMMGFSTLLEELDCEK
jgi:hypothetical protein